MSENIVKRGRMVFTAFMVFMAVLCTTVPGARAADVRTVTRTCSISSDHPYWNSEDLSWPVGEMGAMACRVNFSCLEVEDGYDFVVLNSSYGTTSVTGSHPDGCWTDWVAGTSFTLRLVTNSYNTDYGFDAVAFEIQLSIAWESFWWVAIPVLVAIAAVLIALEVRARWQAAKEEEQARQAKLAKKKGKSSK